MKKLVVPNNYDSKKLSKFVLDTYPNLSYNTFNKALRQKDIKIDGKRVNKDCLLFSGSEIIIYISDELLLNFDCLDIIYEDDNILVINKSANIEVTGQNSLTNLVHIKYSDCDFLPMPCHRLDRNTTGLILFAKNEASLNILLDKFKNHEIMFLKLKRLDLKLFCLRIIKSLLYMFLILLKRDIKKLLLLILF